MQKQETIMENATTTKTTNQKFTIKLKESNVTYFKITNLKYQPKNQEN